MLSANLLYKEWLQKSVENIKLWNNIWGHKMKRSIVIVIVALSIALSVSMVYASQFVSIEFFDPVLVARVDKNAPVAYEYREVLGVEWQFAMVVIATPDDQDIGVLGDPRSTVANIAMEALKSNKPIRIGRADSVIVSIGLADWD